MAQRSVFGLVRSRTGILPDRPRAGSLAPARRLGWCRRLSPARAGCVLVLRRPALHAEERIAVPIGAGDRLGNCRQGAIPGPLPLEAVRQDQDAVGLVLPTAVEPRARLDPRTGDHRLLV